MTQGSLDLHTDERSLDVERIHASTGIYTVEAEISALLDRMEWPTCGNRLLDPGAGNGGFLVAALSRIRLDIDDVHTAVTRVHGYEFHPGAVSSARAAVADHLVHRGWSPDASRRAASLIVENKDFLLDDVPVGIWDRIAANPPYLRYANLPVSYRRDYDQAIAPYARPDMLYAYMDRVAQIMVTDGVMGIICADRWLLNSGSARLRATIGRRWNVIRIERLDSASSFYRPKSKRRGTPARVHPVAMVLGSGEGRPISEEAFVIDEVPSVEGPLLSSISTIRLAPWLGPDGIFLLDSKEGFDPAEVVPCYEPEDLAGQVLGAPRRWALATSRQTPSDAVLRHLQSQLHRMPARGRQKLPWLPPETFHGRLPLDEDAVVVPRISTTLRGIRLPAGTMPVNHNLVVVSGRDPDAMIRILSDARVRAQADALALRLESGYRSYTATLLRNLRVPEDLL